MSKASSGPKVVGRSGPTGNHRAERHEPEVPKEAACGGQKQAEHGKLPDHVRKEFRDLETDGRPKALVERQ